MNIDHREDDSELYQRLDSSSHVDMFQQELGLGDDAIHHHNDDSPVRVSLSPGSIASLGLTM